MGRTCPSRLGTLLLERIDQSSLSLTFLGFFFANPALELSEGDAHSVSLRCLFFSRAQRRQAREPSDRI